MGSVIGEHLPGHEYFSTMIATTTIQHQPSREHSHYRAARSSTSPRHGRSTPVVLSTRSGDRTWDRETAQEEREGDHSAVAGAECDDENGGAVRRVSRERETAPLSSSGVADLPSPPNSSSPSVHTTPAQDKARGATQNAPGKGSVTSPKQDTTAANRSAPPPWSSSSGASSSLPQQPSPGSEDTSMADADGDHDQNAYSSATTPPRSGPAGQVIEIRDLAHIRSLARADLLTGNGPGILNDTPLQERKYDIHSMPINDIIEMVASLLSKITQTNDLQHDAIQRNATHQQQASQNSESGSGSQMSPLSTSVLAFHGKNVPAITIHSYLSRIHRYCPTTYEVFLSLLVYFDRMTERVNDMVMKNEQAKMQQATVGAEAGPSAAPDTPSVSSGPTAAPAAGDQMQEDREDSGSVETDSDLADDDDDDDDDEVMEDQTQKRTGKRRQSSGHEDSGRIITGSSPAVTNGPATYFVVDSFNIHRLIIAGVTCASKFFSDVFYTNSRYAKVGGLPLPELNHLELQFLLLNDFQLFIPVEDLDAYATMLVEFYAREVVSQTPQGGSLD